MIQSNLRLLTVIILTAFFVCAITLAIVGRIKFSESAFAGTVQVIEYDIKGYPTFTILGKKHTVSFAYSWKNYVRVGDYIEKKSGNKGFKIIKQRDNKILYIK